MAGKFAIGILAGIALSALAIGGVVIVDDLRDARQARIDYAELTTLRVQHADLMKMAVNAGLFQGALKDAQGNIIARSPGYVLPGEAQTTSTLEAKGK